MTKCPSQSQLTTSKKAKTHKLETQTLLEKFVQARLTVNTFHFSTYAS